MNYPTNRNFEDLINAMKPYMRFLLQKNLFNSNDIEDVVTLVMVSIAKDEAKLKHYSDAKFRNLVYLRVKHTLTRYLESNGPYTRSKCERLSVTRTVALEDLKQGTQNINSKSTMNWEEFLGSDTDVKETEQSLYLSQLCSQLSPFQRKLIQEVYLNKQSIAEIARELNVKVTTVHKNHERALRKLKNLIQEEQRVAAYA